jgi:hypothetical protein
MSDEIEPDEGDSPYIEVQGEDRVKIGNGVDDPKSDTAAQRDDGEETLPRRVPAVAAIDQTERAEVLAIIRQIFDDGFSGDREDTVRAIARELGYQRTGHRIQEILDNDLRTAVRRGILENSNGKLQLLARSITDYERHFLKKQFLAAIDRPWIHRDEAIQTFARWLGFRRTGPLIEETARSLINGLIREGRLESDGSELIRRVGT